MESCAEPTTLFLKKSQLSYDKTFYPIISILPSLELFMFSEKPIVLLEKDMKEIFCNCLDLKGNVMVVVRPILNLVLA